MIPGMRKKIWQATEGITAYKVKAPVEKTAKIITKIQYQLILIRGVEKH